jgi:DNA-binding NarL/FixJ family response regulator
VKVVKERKRKAEVELEEDEKPVAPQQPVELDVVEALRKAREELQSIKDTVLEARRETRYILQAMRPRIAGVTLERIRPRNLLRRLLGR